MKKILLRAFIYALVCMIILFGLTAILSEKASFGIQEVIGYAGIVLSLLFVYFGIRQYRDQVNGGYLSFGQGLKVGLLIVLIPAILFASFDLIYTMFINPDFFNEYYTTYLEQMRATLPAAEFEAKAKELEAQKELFSNKPVQFGLMFIIVFAIGVIITVISSLVLRKNINTRVA